MVITDVKIRKTFEEGPMKAVASVTLDGAFAIHDIKLIAANEKYFIVMPSKKVADGTYRDICHPINADFRTQLEASVLEAYEKAAAEASAAEVNE